MYTPIIRTSVELPYRVSAYPVSEPFPVETASVWEWD